MIRGERKHKLVGSFPMNVLIGGEWTCWSATNGVEGGWRPVLGAVEGCDDRGQRCNAAWEAIQYYGCNSG